VHKCITHIVAEETLVESMPFPFHASPGEQSMLDRTVGSHASGQRPQISHGTDKGKGVFGDPDLTTLFCLSLCDAAFISIIFVFEGFGHVEMTLAMSEKPAH
jgi:hypothetical protein